MGVPGSAPFRDEKRFFFPSSDVLIIMNNMLSGLCSRVWILVVFCDLVTHIINPPACIAGWHKIRVLFSLEKTFVRSHYEYINGNLELNLLIGPDQLKQLWSRITSNCWIYKNTNLPVYISSVVASLIIKSPKKERKKPTIFNKYHLLACHFFCANFKLKKQTDPAKPTLPWLH